MFGEEKRRVFRRSFDERQRVEVRPGPRDDASADEDDQSLSQGPAVGDEARTERPDQSAEAPLFDADDAEATLRALDELECVPPEVFDRVLEFMEEGGGISVGDRPIPQLRGGESLVGAPRGWPEGSSWADVAGVYIPGLRRLLVNSSGESGSGSVMLHEFGHAADAAYGLASHERRWTTLHGALALLVQRSDQSDRQLADHENRLDALERTRWPLPSIAALVAILGLILTLWQTTTAR